MLFYFPLSHDKLVLIIFNLLENVGIHVCDIKVKRGRYGTVGGEGKDSGVGGVTWSKQLNGVVVVKPPHCTISIC